MKSLKSKLSKLAFFAIIGAFSFGLAISCASNHKQNINKVFAEESDGTWTLTDGSLKFQYTDWQTNGYVTQTNQTMVHGNGDGTFDIGYELRGDPPGATTASTQTLAEKTIQLTGGYWTPSETGGYGTVSGFPVNVNGLDSGTMITLNIAVQYSGDMNEQGSGGGDDENTVVYYDASVGFYYGTTERVVLTVTSVDFTGSDNFDNGTATVFLINDGVQYFTTMSNVSLNPVPTNPSGESYTGEITGYIDESQCSVNYYPLESVPLNYEVEATPEPPALSALEWYFDTDMGYFATHPYRDNYYSFELSTQINSVIYDRENFTVTAHCTVDVREGNMPEEYYDTEMTFAYTFESSGLVENDYHFYNAVCEGTFEDKEEIYFSVDVVSFRQIGWYFDEDLRYYVEEGVEASWNILHAEYRTEDSRNELILYMQILYDNEYTDDVIQINNPNFDEIPYRGQLTLGTGVNGWSDKLQQRISLDINYVPFGYYANGWSYDPYFNQLVYINADDIDMKYQLTSASSNEGSYLLTYTCDGDSQSITVTEAVYQDEMLTGEVLLVENSDPITVSVSVPQSIIDGGTTSTYEFHISFDGNGATSGRMSDDSFTSPDYSVDYELPECSFEKEDYVFFAWSLSNDGMITIKPNETRNITYSEDGVTFYAIWGRTISFDSNGGDGYMEPLVVKEGYNEVPSCGFSRDGYAFKCWAVGSPNGAEINAGSRVNVDGNYVLYAIWEEITSEYYYSVIFEGNGATSGTMDTDTFTSNESPYMYLLPACNFERENYTFSGWSLYEDGNDKRQPNTAIEIQSGDTRLYAIWEEVSSGYTYSVIFNGNGATSGSMDDDIFTSSEENSYPYILPECGFSRDGYTFAGWGTTETASPEWQPRDTTSIQPGETTFYAIWTQLFTISFDANGGEGMMENITIPKGNATVPECGFTREGYSFAGWAVGSPTGDVYPSGESVYVSANYVLFATWEAITPITEVEISVAESEVILYVDDTYIIQYTVSPEDAAGELIWKVEDEKVAAVIEDGMLVGLNVGSTIVTISDRSGNTSVSFVVYVVEKPVPVQPENPISEETIENISNAIDNMELSEEQIEKIQNVISENQEYISDEAGDIIYQALLGTTISSDDPVVAEAQKELVVAVVEAGVAVDAGKATNISGAQIIDKALPENANFSVEGEIQEFYERQMAELFGGEKPTRSLSRAGTPTHGIDTGTKGKEGQEAVDYLANEQLLYKKMGDFVESGVDHMGKAALKLRKCSGEAVTVQVKSYVARVKVSSFREFDKEAADKEFVEAAYKAILLSMQNEVISILEKEHKPSNNAEKEAQYTKELEAVKDIESFEIMVTEVLRQKYVALTGENIEDVDAFHPIYWEIFSAWALDKASPYPITLEELTQTTIEQSTSRARAFTINSDLTGGEWGFIAGIIAGSAAIITAAAVIPTVLKKKRAKEGNK